MIIPSLFSITHLCISMRWTTDIHTDTKMRVSIHTRELCFRYSSSVIRIPTLQNLPMSANRIRRDHFIPVLGPCLLKNYENRIRLNTYF